MPNYSTLSRRAKSLRATLPVLRKTGEAVHLLVDRTELKLFGEGEWKVRKQGPVQTGMALRWCHKADGAVAMLVVVPMGQLGDPAPCGQQIFKRLDRQFGAVLQGCER